MPLSIPLRKDFIVGLYPSRWQPLDLQIRFFVALNILPLHNNSKHSKILSTNSKLGYCESFILLVCVFPPEERSRAIWCLQTVTCSLVSSLISANMGSDTG